MLTDPTNVSPEGRELATIVAARFGFPLDAALRAQAIHEQRLRLARGAQTDDERQIRRNEQLSQSEG